MWPCTSGQAGVWDSTEAADGDRGLCRELRKSSSTPAVQNVIFSQRITLLLLHCLRGRSAQPLRFQGQDGALQLISI